MKIMRPLALLAALLVLSCGKNENNTDNNLQPGIDMGTSEDMSSPADAGNNSTADDGTPDMVSTDPPYDDCSITVWPQDNARDNFEALQNAMFDVEEGGVVCIADGTYSLEEEVSLDTANVEVRGQSTAGTILDFSAQTEGANGLSATSDGVVISTLTVRNTPGDALRVTGSDGVTFRALNVTWSGGPQSSNGAYGLYPVQSQNVLIENCTVSYASDAGIYVGQSSNVIVRDSEAFGNVAGIEIENTTGADVYNNNTHNNTGGLLIFDLPGPPVQGGNSNKIHDNMIVDNNEPNFAEAGNIVALVPAGTGMFILSSDRNEIHDNTFSGNQSLGVAIISFQTVGQPYDFNPEFDPHAEGNWVHDNVFDGNGQAPLGFVSLITSAAQISSIEALVWDGIVDAAKDNTDGSLTNCFSGNTEGGQPAAYRMVDGEGGFANQSTDIGANDCQHTPLPATVIE